MNWPVVTLGELSKSGGQYGVGLSSRKWRNGDPRYIRITDIRDDGRLNPEVVAPDGDRRDWEKAALHEGDLLFARSGATVGKTYIHPADASPAVYAGYLIRFQLNTDRVVPKYVFRFTQSPAYCAWVASTQRAVAQPNINAKQYAALSIPLPPLAEQRRIASVLDHADALRTKRRRVAQQFDDLSEAIFLDTFGDPVQNPKGWPIYELGTLSNSGLSNGAYFRKESYAPDGVEMVHMSDVFYDFVRRGNLKRVRASNAEIDRYAVTSDDLLIARRSLNYSGAAKPCLVPRCAELLLYESSLIRFRPNEDLVRTKYLFHVFNNRGFRRREIAKIVTGTTIFGVSQSNLARVRVPVPPVPLQDRFLATLGNLDVVEGAHSASAAHLDSLFTSLQSRAFSGQLWVFAMGNFDFLKAVDWPEIYGDCARAESYATSDPRSACFYSRRSAEQLVDFLYDILVLPVPYKTDLAAKVNDTGFQSKVGMGIVQKLNLIRKLGNFAVHDTKQIPQRAALDSLKELHHVMLWAAFRYSTAPQAVPMKARFDPALAARAAPLSREEIAALATKFKAQDEAHAKALAEKDELAAAKDAEIAELRAQIKAAQAANTATDDRDYSEAETRDRYIDVLLNEAGWPLADARDREYKVTGMPNGNGAGYADYVLWGADGLPLAVVEAKRTTVNADQGQQQAKLYADCLQQMTGRRPVIFYTNGYEHWVWDDAAGYPPRQVQGFFTADELELMIARRTGRQPLLDAPIDSAIVERHYQIHAIRRIGEEFTNKKREALLVMATGSGKTRTVIALAKQLMEAGWAQAGAVLGRPHRAGHSGRQCVQNAPAQCHDGEPGDREGQRRAGVRQHLSHDAQPHQRHRRRPAHLRARLLRPGGDRRGAPLGVPEVPGHLRLVRFAAGRVDRHPERRGRPQHVPAVPPRRRRPHRRLRPG